MYIFFTRKSITYRYRRPVVLAYFRGRGGLVVKEVHFGLEVSGSNPPVAKLHAWH